MDETTTLVLAAVITAIIGPIIKDALHKTLKPRNAVKLKNCEDQATINLVMRIMKEKGVTFDKVHFVRQYKEAINTAITFKVEYNKAVIITRIPNTDTIVLEVR